MLKTIGVREAKAQLSQLLRDVRQGQEWIITERGLPVAKLVAIRAEALPLRDRLRRLERDGTIEAPVAGPRRLPPPLRLEPALAQRLLQSDRDAG